MKDTLYQIADEYLKAFGAVTVNEQGELEGFELFENLAGALDDKIDNVCLFIKSEIDLANDIKERAAEMIERAQQHAKRAEWFKNYLANQMQAVGKTEFESALNQVKFRKSESVDYDESKLAEDWYITKTEKRVDKVALKKAIKAGQEVEGAWIVEKQNIQIK